MVLRSNLKPEMEKQRWRVGKKVGLLLGVIIIGGIAVFAYSQYQAAMQSRELGLVPVTVSGPAQTVGTGKTAVRVDFGACAYNYCVACDSYGTNCSQGCSSGEVCYTSSHSASISNGRYSTVLQNHFTYDVFLVFESQGIQSYCYAGSPTVNSAVSGLFTYNVSC